MRDVAHVELLDPAFVRACERNINERAWGRDPASWGPNGEHLTWASIPAERMTDVELVVDDVLEWAARKLEEAQRG